MASAYARMVDLSSLFNSVVVLTGTSAAAGFGGGAATVVFAAFSAVAAAAAAIIAAESTTGTADVAVTCFAFGSSGAGFGGVATGFFVSGVVRSTVTCCAF